MDYIKEHNCYALDGNNLICIEQYDDNGKLKWYWINDGELNQILFCPYCGEKLS